MYSLVLMTVMAGSGDATAFHGRFAGCSGCYGSCTGYTASSYYGQSCYGSGCYGGCSGASYFGGCGSTPVYSHNWDVYSANCSGSRPLLNGIFGHRSGGAFHGGSCYGSSCHGSSCYGSSCYGSSCYGSSCYGSSCYGSSCYGSSCYGSSCFGTVPPGVTIYPEMHSAAPTNTTTAVAKIIPATTRADLVLSMPATAKLFVDGKLVEGEGTSRNFHTPELPADQTFFYDMRAEMTIDGKSVTEDLKVMVKSGDKLAKSFVTLLAAAEKAKPTTVAAK